MNRAARAFGASLLALIALSLILAGGPTLFEAYHARRPVVARCTADLASIPARTWVSLEECAIDTSKASTLHGDPHGVSLTLVPLRGREDDLGESGGFALAFGGPEHPGRFVPYGDATEPRPLGDVLAVVLGPLDGLERTHRELPGVDTGLTPGAIVLQARTELPPVQLPLTLLAGGGVFLVLAVWVAMRGRRAPVPGVRWGLVAVLLIVSLAASLRWVQWFMDPVRPSEDAVARNARRPPPVRRVPVVSKAALPEPTAEELAALGADDGLERLRAADLLMARAVTPELVTAVEGALVSQPVEAFRRKLVCLKAQFPGPDTLSYLLRMFPGDRRSLSWTLTPDVKCMLDALVSRVAEDPERVRDALVPGAFSDNAAVRSAVHAAFRTLESAELPGEILAALSADDSWEYRHGLQAALALGAVRYHREAVEDAADHYDPSVQGIVRHALVTSPHANAARIVVRRWLADPSDASRTRVARDRERQQHDVSAALLEIVMDGNERVHDRAAAVQLTIVLDEVGVVPALERLRPSLGAGPILDAVNEAISSFDPKRRRPHRMRALSDELR